MKGKVHYRKDKLTNNLKMTCELIPENKLEKKFLLNAFYCIGVGVLSSRGNDIESLVLWTDRTHKLPKIVVPEVSEKDHVQELMKQGKC